MRVQVLVPALLLVLVGVPFAVSGGWWLVVGLPAALVGQAVALVEVTTRRQETP